MPRKIVIVAVGVILAILALSFFATGHDLNGKPMVLSEETYIRNCWQDFDDINYKLTCSRTAINVVDRKNHDILLTVPAYEKWRDLESNEMKSDGVAVTCKARGTYDWCAYAYCRVHAYVPKEYTRTYTDYGTKRTLMYPSDFYLLSMLCLIGLSFLAMYAAFTSRRK
jgi:hypothetical protein